VKRRVHARTSVAMGTFITVQIVGGADRDAAARDAAMNRALGWFDSIEASCSRFEPGSELAALTRRVGEPVPVSAALFEALQFAIAMAEETGGAFDPVVGAAMESRGFNREHRTGATISSGVADDPVASYRDVRLDAVSRSITLLRPLLLDLGATAKGLAVDMAARELQPFENFAVDAGGDLYFGGTNADDEPWRVGIRHPRIDNAIIDAVRVSGRAVCTSGDYERTAPDGSGHILDPRTRAPVSGVASVTAIAETAMLADAAGTAAFVLGPAEGITLFERLGIDGLVISSTLDRFATRGIPSEGGPTILSNTQRPSDDRADRPHRDRRSG
jgi:FAD:protein FMN transferase